MIVKKTPFPVPAEPFPQKLLLVYVDIAAAGTYSVHFVNKSGLVINDELIVGQVVFKQVNDVSAGQLENSLYPIETKVAGIVTAVKPVQPLKVLPPSVVTEAGIVTLAILVHPAKALEPSVVNVAGKSREAISKFVQPLKALTPIVIKPEGIEMEVNKVHPLKALVKMVVTVEGITQAPAKFVGAPIKVIWSFV